MPIYEFVCRDCDNLFEHMQSFSAKGHPPCPRCGSNHISRMIGRPAIHFKGSGWYVTDSKSSSKQSANGGSPGSNESGAAASDKPASGKASDGESKPSTSESQLTSGESKSEAKPSAATDKSNGGAESG